MNVTESRFKNRQLHMEDYTDLINNMSNKYSIDADGLVESIRLSAGTLTEAHMSIEQAATMFATANKYYNDPSYLGNTAKIGSLRMRASSGDTDAIEGEWETISPCDCHSGGYCLLVSSF